MSSPIAMANEELHELIRDYNEFELCVALGITPDQLGERDGHEVRKWLEYMSVYKFGETFRQAQMMSKIFGG